MQVRDAKTVYAQSSDIKSRTYLEYRKDMKNKAIVELEALDWLPRRLAEHFGVSEVRVEKAGGDAFLWFLRAGGVSRQPDFNAIVGNRRLQIEFQYAEKAGLSFYDFKLSKVGKKSRKTKKRISKNVLFAYIHKPLQKYALLEAAWIMEHGRIGPVPAWGNREAYRVPREIFEAQLRDDPELPHLLQRVEVKKALLDFQHAQIRLWQQALQHELERVMDEEELLQWRPKRLSTFFKVCFTLEHLDRTPRNAPLWLVYAGSYLTTLATLEEAAFLAYILDFLYGRIPVGELEAHEGQNLAAAVIALKDFILGKAQPNGAFVSSARMAPLDETRLALFALNLLEDLTQDLIFYYKVALPPIRRIYEWLPDITATYRFVMSAA